MRPRDEYAADLAAAIHNVQQSLPSPHIEGHPWTTLSFRAGMLAGLQAAYDLLEDGS